MRVRQEMQNRLAPGSTPRIDTTVHAALRVVTNELRDDEVRRLRTGIQATMNQRDRANDRYRSLDEHYNARTDLCTDIAELFVDFEAGDISRNEAWRRMRDHLVDHEFLNEEDDDA